MSINHVNEMLAYQDTAVLLYAYPATMVFRLWWVRANETDLWFSLEPQRRHEFFSRYSWERSPDQCCICINHSRVHMMTDERVSGYMCEEWQTNHPGCGPEPRANQRIALYARKPYKSAPVWERHQMRWAACSRSTVVILPHSSTSGMKRQSDHEKVQMGSAGFLHSN